ncbi:GntR family transcriptional regulator [Pseudomonas sp. HR1]|uniref:GntR family transcriptional regulator n=1 Tax=Pseudomonas oryzihabitans TaxID=47885 RepID=A0ABX3IYD1_9PSED|nr:MULTISPECIES: GntR family transcriptional regulator [Pseudomonas]MBH3329121.1 GntR family transcriptional regulator [Pseudomonas oryzihabitans]MDK4198339.1 GntR family transcriptional regulator [Pseudomonas sp. HR1]ONN72718.1 GntR family transcriptional regulator [Pseudomonas psychrotolerans]QEU05393.1 GntR family transcriptional regulator [Pseudomonas oryzihabitans]
MSGKDAGALSLGAQLLLEMREDIIGGRLLPGTALVEAELVKAYNASRNTIREALHQLDREGLATYVRHKGVMVRRLGLAEVRDLFTVRRTLELQAILTSRPLREYQSDRMLDALEAAELAQSREDWRALGTHGLHFHQHIVGLLGSPLFDEFFATVAAQIRLLFSLAPDEEHFQRPWVIRDRQIHDLLAAGQRQAAAEAMASYLDDSENRLLDLLSAARPL